MSDDLSTYSFTQCRRNARIRWRVLTANFIVLTSNLIGARRVLNPWTRCGSLLQRDGDGDITDVAQRIVGARDIGKWIGVVSAVERVVVGIDQTHGGVDTSIGFL